MSALVRWWSARPGLRRTALLMAWSAFPFRPFSARITARRWWSPELSESWMPALLTACRAPLCRPREWSRPARVRCACGLEGSSRIDLLIAPSASLWRPSDSRIEARVWWAAGSDEYMRIDLLISESASSRRRSWCSVLASSSCGPIASGSSRAASSAASSESSSWPRERRMRALVECSGSSYGLARTAPSMTASASSYRPRERIMSARRPCIFGSYGTLRRAASSAAPSASSLRSMNHSALALVAWTPGYDGSMRIDSSAAARASSWRPRLWSASALAWCRYGLEASRRIAPSMEARSASRGLSPPPPPPASVMPLPPPRRRARGGDAMRNHTPAARPWPPRSAPHSCRRGPNGPFIRAAAAGACRSAHLGNQAAPTGRTRHAVAVRHGMSRRLPVPACRRAGCPHTGEVTWKCIRTDRAGCAWRRAHRLPQAMFAERDGRRAARRGKEMQFEGS